jgi:class 3 adenylate cyclase
MNCGTALAPAAPERWKLATLVFCDLSGSTAMGERLDAEAVRSLMLSYFHEMRGALLHELRHGPLTRRAGALEARDARLL